MAQSRYYLEVPREEKDEAKALGARWDPEARHWWCQKGTESAFSKWDPRRYELPHGCGADIGSMTALVQVWQQLIAWHTKAYGEDMREEGLGLASRFFEEDPDSEATWSDVFWEAARSVVSVVARHEPDAYQLPDGAAVMAYVLDEVFDGGGYGSANDLRFGSPYGSSYFPATWVAEARQCPRYLSYIGADVGMENYPVDFSSTTVLVITRDLAIFPAERHVIQTDYNDGGQTKTLELMDVLKPLQGGTRLHDEDWATLMDLANLYQDWDDRDQIGYKPRQKVLLMRPKACERKLAEQQMREHAVRPTERASRGTDVR